MADFPSTITDAGRALLAAAGVGGTVLIDSIRITNGQWTPNPADTTMQGTLLKTYPAAAIGGRSSADEFEYSISDTSTDIFTGANSIGGIGLYSGTTLFAVSSRPSAEGFLYEKVSSAPLIVANIYKVSGLNVSGLTFNSLTVYPQASEGLFGTTRYATEAETNVFNGGANNRVPTVQRMVGYINHRLATTVEALAGTNAVKLLTPARAAEMDAQRLPAGAILDFGGTTAPVGYLLCQGQPVSRTTYSGLFTAIGTTWGSGDGSTTFNVPDFRRRVTVGAGGTGGNGLNSTVGSTGGAESRSVPLPSHDHDFSPQLYNQVASFDNIGDYTRNVVFRTFVVGMDTVPTNISTEGTSGATMQQFQPSIVVNKIIKT